ncbi:DUF4136 domain-containing protein [Sphingomonas rhizophila]|uniref:DUF4136 domain-containing protein n=1 Tax=Sphingomonas rhizophila TaxID=2071607 RepID=UPI001FE3FE9B|nr:DUF4136 domain-containing protein [Sphingomonas rhizophila]
MAAQGYAPAPSPAQATMLVEVNYGVDQGTTEYDTDPFYPGMYAPGYWGRPYYSRYGYWGPRSPFYYGWDSAFGGGLTRYTVYRSNLDMRIVRRADNASLFEGHAKARSQTDNLGVLVPNLVEAMFTGFPGRSGEVIKITVPAHRKAR